MFENQFGHPEGMFENSPAIYRRRFHPVGMPENSPAFQRRESPAGSRVPKGRLKTGTPRQTFLRNSELANSDPALKRRAIAGRRFATERWVLSLLAEAHSQTQHTPGTP